MPGNSDIGLVGLAVMGQNLALNIVSRGFQVSVFNRTAATTDAFVERHPGLRIVGHHRMDAFVRSLRRPRRVLIMVQAGAAVDEVIGHLLPHLEPGDIVVDGGNSAFADTDRRSAALQARGLQFVGCGISGGEEGARKGPALMPGGSAQAYEALRPILQAIAARAEGEPCVAHIGPGGSGHFVKMVHNGIEYADMQLIAEAYHLFRASGIGNDEMAGIFNRWNEGPLQSYLIQITGRALGQVDPETGQPIVELILDKAGQKGTGRWALATAAEYGVAVGTIQAAVEARILSSWKTLRVQASGRLVGPALMRPMPKKRLIAAVHDALHASKVVAYAQGLDLMRTVGEARGWNLDLASIASLWRGGCIIRARVLDRIAEAWRADPQLSNLALAPFFVDLLNGVQQPWRDVVALAAASGIPVPAFGAALAWYDSLRTARLPANLLQAQRDFFGAHSYERVDRPEGQFFHTAWPDIIDG